MAFLCNRVKTNESERKVNFNISNLDENNVRVLLFKEFGFKGRTLIFDSSAIDYLSHEISDVNKLTEMVFGSVSLRCHETYFRIHKLSSPNRIMFTQVCCGEMTTFLQVFPFPGSKRIEFCALDPHLSPTVNNLFYLATAPDDATSQNSILSFELGRQLDQQLFHDQFNIPNLSTNTFDSGYAEQSFSSFVISNRSNFNSGVSLNRSQSRILSSDTNKSLSELDLYSGENCPTKTSPTLGLVIILAIASDNDEYFKCYMKHIAFIESVVFRMRQNMETVFNKPSILLSTMIEISHKSTQWLARMFPDLQKCNSYEVNNTMSNKLNRYSEEIHDDPLKLKIASLMFKINHQKFSLLNSTVFPKKYIPQRKVVAVSICNEAEDYFDEFCELLKTVENRETNFFLSTIITATLTYHLGWITTCFSLSPPNKDHIVTSYNSLWRQLTELYGAHGWPIKSAQTIISGSNQNDIISKVLHFVHYFVRCSTVLHNCLERINVSKDNETADTICLNYKCSGNCLTKPSEESFVPTYQMKSTLHKSKVCMSNLSELSKYEEYEENYLSPSTKVTFLLGENEELINLKPCLTNSSTEASESDNDATTLDSSKKLNPFTQHSSSVLHYLCEPIKQKHLGTINIFNNEHSNSKSLEEEEVLNLDNNCDYFKEKNKQVLHCNRKQRKFHKLSKMKIISFPLPRSKLNNIFKTAYASSLKSDTIGKYVPDMAVQGASVFQEDWILKLKRDLYLTRQIYFFDGFVDESVAVVGNVDKWDVEVISSRASINRKSIGMKLDISSLVANMLEVLLQMWNLNFCKKYTATHIEQRLLEICIRSYAFGQLLLHTDICTMDLLTATLHFEINDIPLLMSVASVISPQVTKKYGLSFQ